MDDSVSDEGAKLIAKAIADLPSDLAMAYLGVCVACFIGRWLVKQ